MLNQLQEKKYPLTNDLLFKAVFGQENEKSKEITHVRETWSTWKVHHG